jgi:hypothetical protein
MRIIFLARSGPKVLPVPLPAGSALLGLLALLALVAGCSKGSSTSDAAGRASLTSSASSSVPSSTTHTAAPRSSSAAAKPKPTPVPTAVSSISIPPNLCAATDIAQNTADAYMGALSAGNEKEALACVYRTSVPLATTRSLLAHQSETAVYLPRQGGSDGPTEFDYVGGGHSIRVTVTRLADRHTWVTAVTVSKP